MSKPDLNLLLTLDVLLAEGNVARAAQRLQLSPSAMSRALARLRATTGDPLLVRAGRGLVPTPRALALREQVSQLLHDAQVVLSPADALDLAHLQQVFTLRVRDGFVENYGAALLAHIAQQAPRVRLRFIAKPDKDSTPLRDGSVDLELGVPGDSMGPEVRVQGLFRDRFVGVVRPGHPLCSDDITPARYAACGHVYISRRAQTRGAIDDTLDTLGLQRDIVTIVSDFSAALALVRATDLIATVPEHYTSALRRGLHTFTLPPQLATPPFSIAMCWHPRLDADPAQRWLRGCVRAVCGRE